MFIYIAFEVLCIHFVDLVKHHVLTLVSEIQRDRNDRYYYHYYYYDVIECILCFPGHDHLAFLSVPVFVLFLFFGGWL